MSGRTCVSALSLREVACAPRADTQVRPYNIWPWPFHHAVLRTLSMPFEATEVPIVQRTTRRRSKMFRALGHRNYRLFWSGAFLSNIGTWMQAVAQGYLVYDLTHSPFWLGFDGFVAMAPGLVFSLVGGVFADLLDRRRLLLYTQAVAGIAAL